MNELSKINWSEVRHDYITSSVSCRALGRKYGIDNSNIARRAREEDWPSARREYQEELVRKSIERVSEKRAETFGEYAKEFKTDIIRIHRLLVEKIYESLVLKETLSPKDLKSLTSMTKDLLRNWSIINVAEPGEDDNTLIVRFVDPFWTENEEPQVLEQTEAHG